MPLACHAPVPAADRHEIPDGGRSIVVHVALDWGNDDLRGLHQADYAFCSFECAAAWFTEKSGEHDGHVLVDGDPPEGDEPS